MSLLKESDIENLVIAWATGQGWLCPKLQWVNQTGWPDRTFIKNGIVAWIEFKKPGGVVSKKQKYWHDRMREHGANVITTDDEIVAQAYLAALELEYAELDSP